MYIYSTYNICTFEAASNGYIGGNKKNFMKTHGSFFQTLKKCQHYKLKLKGKKDYKRNDHGRKKTGN